MSIGTASNFKVADCLTNGRSNQRVAKRPVDTGGGGGGAPEWVPANAKIYIDLVNDRAWTETDGEVAIDTLLGTDANTENAWAITTYDPANLDANGYTSVSDRLYLALIGGAREKLFLGCTFVTKLRMAAAASSNINMALVSADGSSAIEYDIHGVGPNKLDASSWSGTYHRVVNNVVNYGGLTSDAANALAITITADRSDFAMNGTDAVTDGLSTDDYPVSGPGVLVAFVLQLDVGQSLQSITIYDALPSTAGLSALSVA